MKNIKRPLIYILGLSLLGLSVALFQNTNLGMGSWDALNRNFYEGIPLDYRYLTPIMAMILVGLAYLIGKKKPQLMMLFPIVISFYIGLVIDLLLLIIPNVSTLGILFNLAYVFLALSFVAIGLNMIVICEYPLPALDQFCMAIAKKLKITFGKGKLIGEVLALLGAVVAGLIFSHQEYYFFIGLNTIIAILFIGKFVDVFAKPVKDILGDINGNRNFRG